MARKEIPIDLRKVEEYAQACDSEEEIARALGISQDTLTRRKKDYADFADAIKRGKAKANIFVGGKLMQACRAGNITAIIFYLKTRAGWKETQRIEADVTQREGVPEGLPAIYAALKKHVAKND